MNGLMLKRVSYGVVVSVNRGKRKFMSLPAVVDLEKRVVMRVLAAVESLTRKIEV